MNEQRLCPQLYRIGPTDFIPISRVIYICKNSRTTRVYIEILCRMSTYIQQCITNVEGPAFFVRGAVKGPIWRASGGVAIEEMLEPPPGTSPEGRILGWFLDAKYMQRLGIFSSSLRGRRAPAEG